MMHRKTWMVSLLTASFLFILINLFVSSLIAQQADPPPAPVDSWIVKNNKSVKTIQNNQVPGNYKVKNDGQSSVSVRVFDSNGKLVAEVELDKGETSGQLGVPLGGDVEITDGPPNTTGAKGTIWKFS